MVGEKVFFTGDARELKEFYTLIEKMLRDLGPFEDEDISENSEIMISNLKAIIGYIKKNGHNF